MKELFEKISNLDLNIKYNCQTFKDYFYKICKEYILNEYFDTSKVMKNIIKENFLIFNNIFYHKLNGIPFFDMGGNYEQLIDFIIENYQKFENENINITFPNIIICLNQDIDEKLYFYKYKKIMAVIYDNEDHFYLKLFIGEETYFFDNYHKIYYKKLEEIESNKRNYYNNNHVIAMVFLYNTKEINNFKKTVKLVFDNQTHFYQLKYDNGLINIKYIKSVFIIL
jgi:hypothetical protein